MESNLRIGNRSFALEFQPDFVLSGSTQSVSRAVIHSGNLLVIVSRITEILKYDTVHSVEVFARTLGSRFAERAVLREAQPDVQGTLDTLLPLLDVAPVLAAPVVEVPAVPAADLVEFPDVPEVTVRSTPQDDFEDLPW